MCVMCDVCAGVQCEEGGDVEVETGGEEDGDLPSVDEDLGASREGSRTDDEAVERFVILHIRGKHNPPSQALLHCIVNF